MATVTVNLRTPAGDQEVQLHTEDEATFDDLYLWAKENASLQVRDFRLVSNGNGQARVIEPDEAAETPLHEGEDVDVIRESSNGG